MTDTDSDPVEVLRGGLQQLFVQVRRPTYRSLSANADRLGLVLRTSTISDLLNGPGTPRWATVEAFVRACGQHARARRLESDTAGFDLEQWYARYRVMEDALAERAAEADAPQSSGGRQPVPEARAAPEDGPAVPTQLPADVPVFTGRAQQVADLDQLLTAADPTTAVVIAAIDGTAGIGKTSLAVHWAHRVAGHFPDGQLYINLRGFDADGAVLAPDDAVRSFLGALQVDPQQIPAGLDAKAALYRSILTGRRVLIVLDNARDSDQVRPLLPGTPGCLVVVTSRNLLTGLQATNGAHPLTLDLLSADEARELLTRRLGVARVGAEPQAVDQLVIACARLPLALAIAAARAQQTGFPLAALAAELHDEEQRLDVLDTGDPVSQIRAVFSWSYATLTPPAARLFRLLGLNPGADIGASAAASLVGQTLPETRRLLSEMVRANLLTERLPGRYAFHDLLRTYAAEQTQLTDSDEQRRAALTRLLDHYLHTAFAAARLLDHSREPISISPAQPGVVPHRLTDFPQAMDWFTAERPALLAAIEDGAARGFDAHVCQLSWTMWTFLYWQAFLDDWVAIGEIAVAAAGRLADPPTQAVAHRGLAQAYTQLGRLDEADTQLRHALDLAVQVGNLVAQGQTHRALGTLWERRGHPERSLDHGHRALEAFEAAGNEEGRANALTALGWYHALLGEFEPARTVCEQALVLHRELGTRDGQAATWDTLGYAHHHLGHHRKAIASYRKAIALYQEIGDRRNEADTSGNLADAHVAAGDQEAARADWQSALTILEDLNLPEAAAIRAKLTSSPPTAPSA